MPTTRPYLKNHPAGRVRLYREYVIMKQGYTTMNEKCPCCGSAEDIKPKMIMVSNYPVDQKFF
jgi:hypothetical protein